MHSCRRENSVQNVSTLEKIKTNLRKTFPSNRFRLLSFLCYVLFWKWINSKEQILERLEAGSHLLVFFNNLYLKLGQLILADSHSKAITNVSLEMNV